MRTAMKPVALLTLALSALLVAPAQMTETLGRIERMDPRFDAIVAPGTVIEKVADGLAWAEGPVWDAADRSLLFSDVPRNAIFRWRADAGVALYLSRSGYSGDGPFAGREPGSNGLTFDREGRLVFCQHGDRRVVRRENDGRLTVLADRFQGKRLNSPNDLVYASNGDLYFSDPIFGLPQTFDDPDKELPFQGVFRLTATGVLTAIVTDLRSPNGIGLSPDERTLYVSNSQSSRPIWMAYELDASGTMVKERQFAEASAWIRPGDGLPDGLKVDAAGNLFATGPGGVHVFAPDGTRLGRIETGVPTGNVAFGPDGVLYIAANHWILRLQTMTAAHAFG
jgi:gluconolactonase